MFVPYGVKALRASKFRNYTLTASGYSTKDLPGPSGYIQWRACYRILRTTLIMLDAASISALHNYEVHIERLTRNFPTAWHMVYSAGELARSSHSSRCSKLLMEIRGGAAPPANWDENRLWDWVFQQLVVDDTFWHTQVNGPALTWMAAGSRGSPKTPAEQLALHYMEGGLKAMTSATEQMTSTRRSTSRSMRRRRRPKRTDGHNSPKQSKGGEGGGGGKKGKGKGGAGGSGGSRQKCFSWNNGTPPCGELSPGQTCVQKIQRLHRCTVCDSPGHPSRSCPKRRQG